MKMRFYVSGPRNEGIVSAHLIKDPETKEYNYELLALDVKGLSFGRKGVTFTFDWPYMYSSRIHR